MEEKRFNCKMEDVPVITGFVLTSMENDKVDFLAFSPTFADPFMDNVRAKRIECIELVKSKDVVKQQKAITHQISVKLGELRVSLNPIEGYLKLANGSLDIQLADFGLNDLRKDISKENVEGVISESQSFVTNLKRNEAVLQAIGLKTEMITGLTNQVTEIALLNQQQNDLKNKRSRVANDNIKEFNDLWGMFTSILNAGRAMYRGVSDVKLKEYTLSSLLKRVHSENGAAPEPAPES